MTELQPAQAIACLTGSLVILIGLTALIVWLSRRLDKTYRTFDAIWQNLAAQLGLQPSRHSRRQPFNLVGIYHNRTLRLTGHQGGGRYSGPTTREMSVRVNNPASLSLFLVKLPLGDKGTLLRKLRHYTPLGDEAFDAQYALAASQPPDLLPHLLQATPGLRARLLQLAPRFPTSLYLARNTLSLIYSRAAVKEASAYSDANSWLPLIDWLCDFAVALEEYQGAAPPPLDSSFPEDNYAIILQRAIPLLLAIVALSALMMVAMFLILRYVGR